jgi:hypothetical protein
MSETVMRSADDVIASLRRDKAELAELCNLMCARLLEVDRERTVKANRTRPSCAYDLMLAMFPDHKPTMERPSVVSLEPATVSPPPAVGASCDACIAGEDSPVPHTCGEGDEWNEQAFDNWWANDEDSSKYGYTPGESRRLEKFSHRNTWRHAISAARAATKDECRVKSLLYDAIVELEYVQAVPCGEGLCASSKGKEIIDAGIAALGVKDLSEDEYEGVLAARAGIAKDGA